MLSSLILLLISKSTLNNAYANEKITRLTNAFSKKLYNLQCATALHFFYYNFMRIHQTLRVTPAMEAGITKHLWNWYDFFEIESRRKVA